MEIRVRCGTWIKEKYQKVLDCLSKYPDSWWLEAIYHSKKEIKKIAEETGLSEDVVRGTIHLAIITRYDENSRLHAWINGEEVRKIDFHLHSTNSDGEEDPQIVIQKAEQAGLAAVAITDHNTFTFTKCQRYKDMEVIPGIEFSTTYFVPAWERKTEVHVVGIFPDGVNPEEFESILDHAGEGREDYVYAILEELKSRGIEITMEEVLAVERNCEHVGQHQIAQVLVEKGIEPDIEAAFDHQIGNFSPYYIPSTNFVHYASMDVVVMQILKSGGIPILAHPCGCNMQNKEVEQLVRDFIIAVMTGNFELGKNYPENYVPGIEVYYQKYWDEEGREKYSFLSSLCKKYQMLESAGSDRHRADQPFCSSGDYFLYNKMIKRLHPEPKRE